MKLLRRFSFPLVSVLFIFFVSVLAVSSIPQVVKADAVTGSDKQQGIAALTERWLRYRAIAGCYTATDVERQVFDKISTGTWLDRGIGTDFRVAVGYLNSDGKVSCGDGSFVTNSLGKIGFASNIESFCSMSTAIRDGKKNYTNCTQGSGEFDMDGSKEDQFRAFGTAVSQKVADHAKFPYAGNGQIKYWVGLRSLKEFCGAKKGAKLTSGETGNVGDSTRDVIVSVIDLGTGKAENYIYTLSKEQSDTINDVWSNKGIDNGFGVDMVNSQDLTCAQLAKLTRDNAKAFGDFVAFYNRANPEDAPPEGTLAGDDGAGEGSSTTSCDVDGVGWIVCPVLNFMAKLNDAAFEVISGFLEIEVELLADDGAKPAWESFRNIANVAFVIVFMIIIYSQLTGVGVSNYGIKRLLPRLIAGAILVNVSYYLCQIAVDVSNILGNSLYTFFKDIPTAGSEGGVDLNWETVTAGILIAAGAVIGALLLASVLGSAALIAFGLIVLILLARKAIIVLLIVVAPLAFVAYLLPNTEQWFKKWWGLFSKLLLVYPVIALIFGASYLAARIVNTAATGGGEEESQTMLQITALGIMAIPLFAVPAALKGAMAATGALGSRLSGWQDRAMGAAAGKGKERYGNSSFARGRALRKEGKTEYRKRQFARAVSGDDDSILGRVRQRSSRGVTGRTFTNAGDFAQGRINRSAAGIEHKIYEEDVEAAKEQQRNMTVADVATIAATGMHNGQAVTEHERAAAIDKTMSAGGFGDRRAVLEGLAADKANTSRELRNRAITAAYSKGDQNIYGVGFGDQILDENGAINGEADLLAATAQNAEEGNIQPEHVVQGAAATGYLVAAATGNAAATANLRTARDTARTNPATRAKIDANIDAHLNSL